MLSGSVNSVPLWLIIVAGKSIQAVYGNRTTETQSAQRTNERRRLSRKQLGSFLGWMERNAERLCASVVYTRRKRLIKTVCRKEKLRKL